MTFIVAVAVLFVFLAIRPQEEFFKKTNTIRLDHFQFVYDDIIDMILGLSREDREQLRSQGVVIVPIRKSTLLKTLQSESEEDQERLGKMLTNLGRSFGYELSTFYALEGYRHAYFLEISIEPDDDYVDYENEAKEVAIVEPEKPKVMTMAAGAGKR